ncbi:hypothetical protein ACPW7J_07805 [Ihubacter sp. rT4E-8]|uniref:hypothetical protein n=1 Tax=unclassified Ihubacter TaxID=2633299 RepID=UPI001379DE0D
MFSQKKKNHTWIYVALALTVVILAVFLLIGALSSRNAREAERVNLESRVQDLPQEDKQDDTQVDSPKSAEEDPEEKEDDNQQFYQSYYLVKYDNNVIKIFFSDETGKLTELEETGIIYETLSAQDQQRFAEGIKLERRDDLNKLMMDYES